MECAVLETELIPLVAERFKALADPRRLALLSALQKGERSVSELARVTKDKNRPLELEQILTHLI